MKLTNKSLTMNICTLNNFQRARFFSKTFLELPTIVHIWCERWNLNDVYQGGINIGKEVVEKQTKIILHYTFTSDYMDTILAFNL